MDGAGALRLHNQAYTQRPDRRKTIREVTVRDKATAACTMDWRLLAKETQASSSSTLCDYITSKHPLNVAGVKHHSNAGSDGGRLCKGVGDETWSM
jgi:hypothetical protein